MRLVVGLFAMFLTASVAHAEEANAPDPKPEAVRPKVPLRVVRVLPESHQALLFDRNRGTHVLADVGGTVDGYKVEDIDDDEVTLSANGREIVLAAPAERTWGRNRGRRIAEAEPVRTARARAPVAAAEGPEDPYADPSNADDPVRVASAADPYTAGAPPAAPAPAPIRVASAAPADPYAEPALDPSAPANPYDDVAPAPAPAMAKPAAKAPAKGPSLDGFLPPGTSADDATAFIAPAPAPAVKPAAAPVPAPATINGAIEDVPAVAAPPVEIGPVITPTVLSRSELNASIADFNRLTNVLRGSFTPEGARLDVVAEGSVFAKAGLRRGDIVTAVDNHPLRTIDDAADLYVRAPQTRAANVQILRAGKPLTLRVLLQ